MVVFAALLDAGMKEGCFDFEGMPDVAFSQQGFEGLYYKSRVFEGNRMPEQGNTMVQLYAHLQLLPEGDI